MFDKNKINNIINKIGAIPEEYSITEDRDGNSVLKITADRCSFYINSKYNCKKEAQLFANEFYSPKDNIFLYGIGMGFHIKALSEKLMPSQHLYIAECNPILVKLAFENTDIANTLEKENIIFAVPENFDESIIIIKEFLSKENASFICHEPSLRAIPREFIQIKEIFDTYIIRRRRDNIPVSLLGDNEKENIIKGYKNAGKAFKNQFKGKPAIVVSAGPSLEINGRELIDIKGKAIIISVGRAFKYLKSIGVKPDFLIIADAKKEVISHLDMEEKEIPLIFLSTVDPSVEEYKGPKYILFEEHSERIQASEKEFSIESGGSVATTATSLAKLMGCDPIILIGQDLCYHSEKMHSGEMRRFVPSKLHKTVKGINGEEYSCPINLYEYLKWFRKFAIKNKEIRLINCTAKGAYIEGFEHKSLKELF